MLQTSPPLEVAGGHLPMAIEVLDSNARIIQQIRFGVFSLYWQCPSGIIQRAIGSPVQMKIILDMVTPLELHIGSTEEHPCALDTEYRVAS